MVKALAMAALLAAGARFAGAGETVTITLPADDARLASGPGVEVTQAQCRPCHSLDYVTMQPKGGSAQWQGVVTKMIKVFGAPINEQDAKTITEYLAAHYAR